MHKYDKIPEFDDIPHSINYISSFILRQRIKTPEDGKKKLQQFLDTVCVRLSLFIIIIIVIIITTRYFVFVVVALLNLSYSYTVLGFIFF